jgi:hypothetical protein
MPTVTIDVKAEKNQSSDVVQLQLSRGERQVSMTARRDWTLERLAEEILAQEFPEEPDRAFEAALSITFHTEEVVDEETGQVSTVRVLDGVNRV